MKNTITKILRKLGVPACMKGFEYLRKTIEFYANRYEDRYKIKISKVYEDFSKETGDKPSIIERSMRYAIEKACEFGNIEEMERLFGFTTSTEKGRPNIMNFVLTIVDEIKIMGGNE